MNRSHRQPAPVHAGPPDRPAAFTLVELLVATTAGLFVIAALTTLFGWYSRSMTGNQDLIQLSARMRAAAWRLRQDLGGVTTEVKPFIRPESASGYFELVEGPSVETGGSAVADIDDILMLTTSSPGRPFTGLLGGSASFESPVAEVAWFCKLGTPGSDGVARHNLYRRQLLVAATPGVAPVLTTNTADFSTWGNNWGTFFQSNDFSARLEASTSGTFLIANSLADLTRRQSRFMHNPGGTGNPAVGVTGPGITTGSTSVNGEILTGVRTGEDLILADVVAFDVRVFDLSQPSGGAYVDLTAAGLPSNAITFTGAPAGSRTYDTWSMHTEFNGVSDAGATTDRGTNLVDDNGNGVVDDAGELEQPPPYTVPLRGVEIRIRCWEPTSKQVRQITVQHSFLVR